jgi:hypothetical protein
MAYIDSRNVISPKEAAKEIRVTYEGYRAMAADRDREEEAEEWSEALVGDSLEAR